MSRPWRAQRNHTPLAVGTSSTRVALRADAIDAQLPSILVDNASSVTVYVLAGGADVVATADSLRIPAGAQLALEIGTAATHLAVLATGAGTIRWQLGEGTLELPAAGTGGGGGGGGGDASAANQATQIGLETAIRDRLPAAGAASQATLVEVRDRLPATLQAGRLPAEVLGQPGLAYQITAGASSTPQALSAGCRRVSLYARGAAIRYAVATGTPTASATSGASTSHYIEQGERLDVATPAGASIAAIRAGSTDGVLEVTELG